MGDHQRGGKSVLATVCGLYSITCDSVIGMCHIPPYTSDSVKPQCPLTLHSYFPGLHVWLACNYMVIH